MNTVNGYWDCDCASHYIHSDTLPKCPNCGAIQSEHATSREDELAVKESSSLTSLGALIKVFTSKVDVSAMELTDLEKSFPVELAGFGWYSQDSKGVYRLALFDTRSRFFLG